MEQQQQQQQQQKNHSKSCCFSCSIVYMLIGIVLVALIYGVFVWFYQSKSRLLAFVFALAELMVVVLFVVLGPMRESAVVERRNKRDYSRINLETDVELKKPLNTTNIEEEAEDTLNYSPV